MRIIDEIFSRAYRRIRGHELSSSIPTSILAGFVTTKAIDLVRGTAHKPRFRSAEGLQFRGRGVVTAGASFISLGRSVAIGPYAVLNGFSQAGITVGNNVTIGARASLLGTTVIREPGEGIWVGDNSAIGQGNIIWGQGGVRIGKDCLLGPNVVIVSENHGTASSNIPIRLQPNTRAQVELEDDCWIGAGATILAGVTVGKGSVVAAGAVVRTSVPPYTVVGGVPARRVAGRSPSADV